MASNGFGGLFMVQAAASQSPEIAACIDGRFLIMGQKQFVKRQQLYWVGQRLDSRATATTAQ